MEREEIPSHRLYGISFKPYDRAGLRRVSIKELTNPTSFTDLKNPTVGGLYDLALGQTLRAL